MNFIIVHEDIANREHNDHHCMKSFIVIRQSVSPSNVFASSPRQEQESRWFEEYCLMSLLLLPRVEKRELPQCGLLCLQYLV